MKACSFYEFEVTIYKLNLRWYNAFVILRINSITNSERLNKNSDPSTFMIVLELFKTLKYTGYFKKR